MGTGEGRPRVDGSFIGGHNIQIGSAAGNVTLALDRPAYRLELLAPTAQRRIARSQRSPSHLLDAQREVVPYRTRPQDQQALALWRDHDEPVSVLLLHGGGGQGKTRLAGWFATESHASGWTVLLAVDKTTPLGPSRTSKPDATAKSSLLVVVDYAERWPLTTLVNLIEDMVFDHPDQRIRILLLARPQQGFWESARAQLARSNVDLPSPLALRPFASTDAERERAFADAVAAFQRILELPHQAIKAPTGLTSTEDSSPLTLHMTALASVCAHDDGVTPPGREHLSDFLLDHERRYWQATALPDEAMARTVFVASLLGPTTAAQARSLLRRAHLADGDAEADRLLLAHERLYPPNTAAGISTEADNLPDSARTAMSPLKPDRFAEDYIAEYLNQPHATELLNELLTEETPVGLVRQCLITLAASARRESARTALFDLLRNHPRLAAHANAAVVDTVLQHADMSLAEQVHDALPHYNTELLRPARKLAQKLYDTLPTDASDEHRAHRLSWLGIRMSEAGDKRAALRPARDVVLMRRRLAGDDATNLPTLAGSLNSLSIILAGSGNNRSALPPVREAIGIYQRLAETDSEYLPDLAGSLNNLSIFLSDVGEKRAALASAQRVVQTYRHLAATETPDNLTALAGALNNFSVRLSEVGDKRAALAPAREAVEIYRRLAEIEPAYHLSALASALNNLSAYLAEIGDKRDALEAVQEAVRIHRRLVEIEPAAHLPQLGMSLTNLGTYLAEVGDKREALEAVQEAVRIRQRLVEIEPAAQLPELASALNNLSIRLSEVGKHRIALKVSSEAVDIYRRLDYTEPNVYLSELAGALSNLGTRLSNVGELRAAVKPAHEAVRIRRGLAEAEPAAHLPELASALNNLGIRLSNVEEPDAALRAAEEAVRIRRSLADAEPAAHLADLASALNNLGLRLAGVGAERAALEPIEEAIEIRRRLADIEPTTHLPELAGALNNLGLRLSNVGAGHRALRAIDEALSIRRRLAETEPSVHLAELARSLMVSSWIMSSDHLATDDAIRAINEAIEIYLGLAAELPDAFKIHLRAAQQIRSELLKRPAGRGAGSHGSA